MEIQPLSKYVGAEIKGVDISRPLPDDIFKRIDGAYNHHSVLVFRARPHLDDGAGRKITLI